MNTKDPKNERLAKVIARAGICSRREAERRILGGRVKLDGKVILTPAINITPRNEVRIDGKLLPSREPTRLWRYHKPIGLLTTTKDPKGRPTIFDRLPDSLPRVISVGRLDINTEGLLLVTNDGELARKLELPATGWSRRYRVRVYGFVDKNKLETLKNKNIIDGVQFGAITATLDRQQGANAWLTLSLSEGKNREIRKILEYNGWPVNRLIRTAYGPFQLGNLQKGAITEVSKKVICEQLNIKTPGERSGAHHRW